MKRVHILAAEIFAYSFDNYADHLGIGNLRFEKYMPDVVRALERAEKEGWDDARLAKAIDVDVTDAPKWRKRYSDAVEIADASTPAAAFRNAVRQTIQRDLGRHPLTDSEVESAVKQICYRAADLSYLLKSRKEPLSQYSTELRAEEADLP